ncbi:hypothetical protein LJ737_12930 [Hymenobacter sp. 15J16-1T3B]|uniref:hypothetical protein n=1 Tax=Hymenobacter sp. 15J16-1T3B TaxID=2886941 RepID=UPI001D11F7D1|nr:hypothetical protein [Hymenobacter sp. 15J16-1T3B]MCC3158146.1 hypothetical protein [Hymenobacter sp. 15J16-1T3B]
MNRLVPFLGGIVVSALLPQAAQAQLSSIPQQFTSSTVVLTNGDTLRGSLVLHTELDLLLITMADHTVRTVPALAVRTFAVRGEIMHFDQLPPQYRGSLAFTPVRKRLRRYELQRARPFLVYPWNHDRDQAPATAPAFFERLNGGPVILLRRQQLVRRSLSWSDAALMGGGGYATQAAGPMYYYTDVRELMYLGTPQGTIVALRRPKRDLLAYFPREAEQLEEYARLHNLDYGNSGHLARLVDYANSLQQATASAQ